MFHVRFLLEKVTSLFSNESISFLFSYYNSKSTLVYFEIHENESSSPSPCCWFQYKSNENDARSKHCDCKTNPHFSRIGWVIEEGRKEKRRRRKMALLFVGGAFLGAAVSELLKAILEVKDKASSCKSILERLKSTLECVTRQLQEIVHLSGDLSDRQKLEIDKLRAELEKGKDLVRKCSKVPCWSYYKRYHYSKKLLKLDASLVRFFQLDMQAEIWCDVKQLLLDVQEGNRKFDRLNTYTSERGGVGSGSGSGSTRSGSMSDYCAFPGIPNLPVGLGVPLKELKMELFRDGVKVLGLCAPGGCGKTTLASMLCQDEQVKERFGENIFFLTISSSPNLITILQRLFEQMDHGFQVNEFQNDEDAVNHLGYRLRQRKQEPMLLVLDDVWCDSFLQKFVVEKVKYKVLVTSRTVLGTFDSTYTLKMLSGSDAMTLFCHLAFPQDDSYERPDEDLLNKIVRGCNGFPLAVKVIAHSLRHQPARKWRSTERTLSRGSSIFDTHKDLLKCLATSLAFLKDDLRECFLDLGSFPEDQMIPAATLIDIWVELYDLNDEDEAYVNLLELSMRNLLNLVESTRKDAGEIDGNFNELSVIQHDLLRDLAIHQSRGNQDITQSKRLMMERREDDLPQSWRDHMHQTFDARLVSINTGEMFSSRWCDLKFPEAEVLMLNFSEMDFNLPRFMENMSKLKVLIITNNGPHHASLDGLAPILGYLSNLKRIRLEKVSVPSLNELTEPLKNLQKLSLVMCEVSHAFSNYNIRICNMLSNLIEIDIDYCDDLMEIPQGICEIRCLQKLSITNCHSLSSLPEEIGQMTDLEVLRLHACTGLIELPDSIRRLQKLRFLDVSDCNLERLPEGIGELCHLRKLDMRRCSRVKKLPRSVIHLKHLKDVICDDEEMRFQWKLIQIRLPELNVRMLRDEINLKWLGFDFMNQMIHY